MFAAGCRALMATKGREARYFKPFTLNPGLADGETAFFRTVFGDDAVLKSPQLIGADDLKDGLGAAASSLQKELASAGGADICIDGLSAAGDSGKASADIARLGGAEVIAVVRYQRRMDLGPVLGLKETFGDMLRGVALNAVPQQSMREAREEAAPALRRAGVDTVGITPEDRLLLGFSVADYCTRLSGRIMNNMERADEIVESLLVGANALDPGEEYYDRVHNKALITRGDRPDLQFSALNTLTRCLILTNGVEPIPYVLDRAVEQEVPIVVVPEGTLATISAIERFIADPMFHHRDKLARAVAMLDAHLDKSILGL
ncbi:MAG: hypothetical protein HW397_489 [Dehalococcoidia bacterium]|nr:hypothetical protein [Dehalococcoidia bacterium]